METSRGLVRKPQESFASGVDVLFEFGIVQHVPWTWVSSVNGKQVLVDVDQAPGITWELSYWRSFEM